jgi:hypothetical protein
LYILVSDVAFLESEKVAQNGFEVKGDDWIKISAKVRNGGVHHSRYEEENQSYDQSVNAEKVN